MTANTASNDPTPAMPRPLWTSNGGEIVCERHGGSYLASAIAARPKARKHSTPLGVWVKVSDAEWLAMVEDFRAACLPAPDCEYC